MKGFLKSKLVLSLAALVMIAAAVAIPLTGSIGHSHAAPAHNKLVIFLQGITTELNSKQISDKVKKGHILGLGMVPGTVVKALGNPEIREYSYFGSQPFDAKAANESGQPAPYNCADTITNPLTFDISQLTQQIFNTLGSNPTTPTDIYLVGHSLGGVVAYGFLAALVANLPPTSQIASLPSGAHLKAVITLDSPIGGVPGGVFSAQSKFSNAVLGANCPGVNGQPFSAPDELVNIYNSASFHTPKNGEIDPQGADATILSLLGINRPPNEELSLLALQQGTAVLTIGNTHDLLWNPPACADFFNGFSDFESTQWVEDQGDGSAVYGRSFDGKITSCNVTSFNKDKIAAAVTSSHFEVTTNSAVQTGITNFLTPLLGDTPSPLAINPDQTTDPQHA